MLIIVFNYYIQLHKIQPRLDISKHKKEQLCIGNSGKTAIL